MPRLRSYRTNLDYTRTYRTLERSPECKSIREIEDKNGRKKGTTDLYLHRWPRKRIEMTTGGFVRIHGLEWDEDEPKLRVLGEVAVTRDGKPFSWRLNKTVGMADKYYEAKASAALTLAQALASGAPNPQLLVACLNELQKQKWEP